MSWQIKQEGSATVVVLDSEMGIQSAVDFYQAILPLAGIGGAIRVDAQAIKSIHTSIMQILYALSQAVSDCKVTEASEDFRTAEARLGLVLERGVEINVPTTRSAGASL